ncbi:glycoside hydrolase domain-containing protein [Streptomyces sp. NPDC003077]|uniref:glycoside hydrolase domain-containing protein n=1 Tax=Streptomyces sp. NPDC003077 TaxID=3154443 RepID=UPI0033A51692
MRPKHVPKRTRGLAAFVAATAALVLPLQTTQAIAASPTGPDGIDVSYRGLSLTVPSGWNVVNVEEHPETCVRLDRNTVYLGHPGANQNCPTHLVRDKTESLVIEPVAGATPRTDLPTVSVPAGERVPDALPYDEGHEVRVEFEKAGLYVTAGHSGSTEAVREILSQVTVDPTARPAATAPSAPARSARAAAATPTTGFTGRAFDACTAPSNAAMADWRADSPYGGVGIYIGGPTRVCAQPNLTASWVQTQTRAGWHLLPIYAGTQAKNIPDSNTAAQGRAAADKAVELAGDLGFAPGTVLYHDMEAYSPTYRTNVLTYLSGWTERVRQLGYRSGVYSSSDSGIKDLASVYNSSTYARPDVVWTALWNGRADVNDPNLPAGYWSNARVHQYAGNVTETYGGTRIQIDRNYMDVDPGLPDPGMRELAAGDFNGDGRKDLVAVQVSTGKLFLYPNTGRTGLDMLGDRVEIGSGGWNGMKDLTVGDFTGDGKDDLVAAKKEDGKLYLYPGTQKPGLGALGDRVEIGSGGWNGMKGLFAGDFDGDGKTDLGAVKTETGELFLYPGTQKSGLGALGDRVLIGTGGWNGMNKLVSPGDFNRDGKPDLIAAKTETGELYFYPGTQKGGLAALGDRVLIGTGGWNGISDYAGADFTGDGIGDLAAVASDPYETGKLYLYKGNGTGLGSRVEIGSGGW